MKKLLLLLILPVAAAGALLWPEPVQSAGPERQLVRFAQLQYAGGIWNPNPTAARSVMMYVGRHTSVPVSVERLDVTWDSPELFYQPLLWVAGCEGFDPLPDDAIFTLRKYIAFGGLIVFDDCTGLAGGSFDRSVRLTVERLYPREHLKALPLDHDIYKSFFLLDGAPGRLSTAREIEGLNVGGRTAILYSKNDLMGAWARRADGTFVHDSLDSGEAGRERAFRLGANIVLYALNVDYKSDQVHIPFILKRRRL